VKKKLDSPTLAAAVPNMNQTAIPNIESVASAVAASALPFDISKFGKRALIIMGLLMLIGDIDKSKTIVIIDLITNLCIFCIVLMSLVFLIIFLFKIYDFNMSTYETLNNVSAIESTNISRVLNMFKVSDTNGSIKLDAANAAIYFYYQLNNPNTFIDWPSFSCADTYNAIKSNDGSGDAPPAPQVTSESSPDVPSTCTGRSYDNKMMYPFVGDDPINTIEPFVLKQEIEKLDLFGQLARLSDAIGYIKSFMLRASDPIFATIAATISDTDKKALRDKIVGIIINSCTIVNNIKVSTAAQDAPTPGDCFAACMDNPKLIAATYNPTLKLCYTVDARTSNANMIDSILYTGPSSNLTLVKTGFSLGASSSQLLSNASDLLVQ
jgi:hypothetical protein